MVVALAELPDRLTRRLASGRFHPNERSDGMDNRQQHLIDTAARVFAARGFHATSMRDLSRESGMSLAGIYHYVRSKHELLFLIQDRCFAEVVSGARRAVARTDDHAGKLRSFIEHHIEFFAGHMEEMKVLSHEDDELDGEMGSQVLGRKREYVSLLHDLLAALPAGAISPQIATYSLFGMMNWIYTWYQPEGEITPAALADQMSRLFLAGYLAGTPTVTGAEWAPSHGD